MRKEPINLDYPGGWLPALHFCLSPDGKTVVACGTTWSDFSQNVVWAWDLESGAVRWHFIEEDRFRYQKANWRKDGRLFFVNNISQLFEHDPQSGQKLSGPFNLIPEAVGGTGGVVEHWPGAMSFSDDGNYFLYLMRRKSVLYIYETNSFKELHRVTTGGDMFYPSRIFWLDGLQVLIGGSGDSVHIDVKKGEIVENLRVKRGMGHAVRDEGKQRLYSSWWGGLVYYDWEAREERILEGTASHPGGNTLALSKDGRTFAWSGGSRGGATGFIYVLDTEHAGEYRTLGWEKGTPVRQLEFSPDGRFLLSMGDDQIVRTWNLETGKDHYLGEGAFLTGGVREVSLSGVGDQIALAADPYGLVVRDADTGAGIKVINKGPLKSGCRACAFVGEDDRLMAGQNNVFGIWQPNLKKRLAKLKFSYGVWGSVVSPDRKLAVIKSHHDAWLWHMETFEPLHKYVKPLPTAISSDGRYYLNRGSLFDINHAKGPVAELPGQQGVFHLSGEQFAILDPLEGIQIYSLPDAAMVRSLPFPTSFRAHYSDKEHIWAFLQWLPDGTFFVSCDRFLIHLDAEGTVLYEPAPLATKILHLKSNNAGDRILAMSSSAELRIYDLDELEKT